ncbi:MAG: hypothetical protein Q7R94_02235 [bacterium]|nr:hypothetical protein [bacterium]
MIWKILIFIKEALLYGRFVIVVAGKKMEMHSFKQFTRDMDKIAEWARPLGFKSVYGLWRGGVPPAIRLSHLLDIPCLRTMEEITEDTLIMEDIIDGGGTIREFLAELKRLGRGNFFRVATLYWNPASGFKPDYFARKRKHFVIFHWATIETSRIDHTRF